MYAYNWAVEYESIFIADEALAFGAKRLLEVTKSLVIPINVPIRFLVTASDVLHS